LVGDLDFVTVNEVVLISLDDFTLFVVEEEMVCGFYDFVVEMVVF